MLSLSAASITAIAIFSNLEQFELEYKAVRLNALVKHVNI